MPRSRPQLSITLPRNFTFHYTEGDGPKTPENEAPSPKLPSPQAYRIRRRLRPSIASSILNTQFNSLVDSSDIPIPTIEIPNSLGTNLRPLLQQRASEPAEGYLAPVMHRRFATAPRTPSYELPTFGNDWNTPDAKRIGESIIRPVSACSDLSDSSDASDGSSVSRPSLGGSCTSPESDAADPFIFPTVKRKSRFSDPMESPTLGKQCMSKPKSVFWGPEMDKHLWTTYMTYLRDPTVTPFKTLPGSPPPLGVCHRVAREAKRTWKGGRAVHAKPTDEAHFSSMNVHREGSPDTIKPNRSGSNTPTASNKAMPWPKSGAATRRRLRELCKRKYTIAPHYQRLMQSRSPSPFASSSRSASRSLRLSSPLSDQIHTSPFQTRDIEMSLSMSTSPCMQPGGALAQLAKDAGNAQAPDDQWFNDPHAQWASPAPISTSDPVSDHVMSEDASSEIPRLGSPFGHHTWGPSKSRHNLRPKGQQEDTDPLAPTLKSPIHLHSTFPYPNTHKRRAQHQLEDELSPGGNDKRAEFLQGLFDGPSKSTLRRVRTRGFTVGGATIHNQLSALFSSSDPPSSTEGTDAVGAPSDSTMQGLDAESIQRLGSPFAGISSRPSRARGARHLATASLSSYDPSNFTSIDQRLTQMGQQLYSNELNM
ncbi:MAG: hypothetical protein MMC33_008129 [Icmadophila ericetorum]|nr:hypothetical protein [Icmadophila ericetorum]